MDGKDREPSYLSIWITLLWRRSWTHCQCAVLCGHMWLWLIRPVGWYPMTQLDDGLVRLCSSSCQNPTTSPPVETGQLALLPELWIIIWQLRNWLACPWYIFTLPRSQVVLMSPKRLAIMTTNQKWDRTCKFDNAARQQRLSFAKILRYISSSSWKLWMSTVILWWVFCCSCLHSTRSAVLGLTRSNLDQGLRPSNN